MKRIKTLTALAAAVCCMATTSQAVLIPAFSSPFFGGTAPTGILPGIAGGPGTTLTVDYMVDLTLGVYTYSYKLNNPITDTTSPTDFSVSFDTTIPGSVIFLGPGASINPGSSVNWSFAPVPPGTFIAGLFFRSLLAPTFGNAGALDSIPPSPWSSGIAGGVPVAVPVPEPTTMIAGALLLLPFAFSTVRRLRKNRTA